MRSNKPVAAVVSIETLERNEELEERLSTSLCPYSPADDQRARHAMDDVLDRFGFTHEDLEQPAGYAGPSRADRRRC